MKRFTLLVTTVLALLGASGCKDAPVDPITGNPVGGNDTSKVKPGPGPIDTCLYCAPSFKRQIVPYFAFAYKKSTNDTAWVELQPEGPVVPHKVGLYSNGTPKSIDLKMSLLGSPFNFTPGVRDVWRIEIRINESLPLGRLKEPTELDDDPTIWSGVAINYRHPNNAFQRLSTGDTVGGQGPGRGHSKALMKFERIDTTHRVITLWLTNMKFILPGTEPLRDINIAPIYVKIPY